MSAGGADNDHRSQVESRRRTLVIVRAGDSSLHPLWLQGSADRSWDLLVSYFGADAERYRRADVIRLDSKGAKWPALRALIESHWDHIALYDYIWLPDDDIACRGRQFDKILRRWHIFQFQLSQPTLPIACYFAWIVTIAIPISL